MNENYDQFCEHGEIEDCPQCTADEFDEDAALDAQDAMNVPNNGDFTGYFDRETLL